MKRVIVQFDVDDNTADSIEDAIFRMDMRKEDVFTEFTSITLFQNHGQYDLHIQGSAKRGAVSTTEDASGKVSNLKVLIEQTRDNSLSSELPIRTTSSDKTGLLEFEWNTNHSDVKLSFGKYRGKFLAKEIATSFTGLMYLKWLYNNHLRITQEVKDFIEKLWTKRQPLYVKKRDIEAESYQGIGDDPATFLEEGENSHAD